MTTAKKMRCAICRGDIAKIATGHWKLGHNAEPVARGQCCDICNDTRVIPVRLAQGREVAFGVKGGPAK